MRTPKRGDRFVHARQLDMSWQPGPGQRYADAPHAIMIITRVTRDRVWFGPDRLAGRPAAFYVSRDMLDDVVAEWLS